MDSIWNNTHWVTTLNEEGILSFPPGLLDQLGWEEGDTLDFVEQPDGSFHVKKVPDNEANSEVDH